MNVLVVGGGGREHAIAWKLAQSPLVAKVYCAPGNAGTSAIAENVPMDVSDLAGLAALATEHKVELTFVGPEVPLVLGIADFFAARNLTIFGPSKRAAMIEGSKSWAKEIMTKYDIPTAKSATFADLGQAIDYVREQPLPVVIKADGLAAGKGVIIAQTHAEAVTALRDILENRVFGKAGDKVVIEEYLTGTEVSVLAVTDGHSVVPLVPACDYKRAYNNDEGPNTGGMGSYSPTRLFSPALMQEIKEKVLLPTIQGLATESAPYMGVLYAGLILTDQGPKVLEYNCRLGDPETQAVLPLMQSDLAELALAAVNGNLAQAEVKWHSGACCGVVLASGGYPGTYSQGYPISGLDKLTEGCFAFHAGTKLNNEGQVVTAGGRVLTLVARGSSMAAARDKVYRNVQRVQFAGCHFRQDIALRETV